MGIVTPWYVSAKVKEAGISVSSECATKKRGVPEMWIPTEHNTSRSNPGVYQITHVRRTAPRGVEVKWNFGEIEHYWPKRRKRKDGTWEYWLQLRSVRETEPHPRWREEPETWFDRFMFWLRGYVK